MVRLVYKLGSGGTLNIVVHSITRRRLPDLIRRKKYRVGAEIGVFRGEYSERILNMTGVDTLYCIDSWVPEHACSPEDAEEIYQEAYSRLKIYGGRVGILRGFSLEISRYIEDSSLDFVYLDASHTYKAVLADLQAWYPKVRKGGMISGHDFQTKGRGKQVDEASLVILKKYILLKVNVPAGGLSRVMTKVAGGK